MLGIVQGVLVRAQKLIRQKLDLSSHARSDAYNEFDFQLLRVLVAEQAREIPLSAPLVDTAHAVIAHNTRESARLLHINPRAIPGLAGQVQAFRDRNVLLISSLVDDQVARVQKILEDPGSVDMTVVDLTELIEHEFGVCRSRAELIATDQVLKFNGQVTQARQQGAGISKYVWTTSLDERVRPTHRALEGQVFSWNAPPSIGHPGQDYRCRCTAFPLLEELDEYT